MQVYTKPNVRRPKREGRLIMTKISDISGNTIGQSGVIVDQRRTRNQMEYLVKFADGSRLWVLAQNVTF